jgi:hypothetical protein
LALVVLVQIQMVQLEAQAAIPYLTALHQMAVAVAVQSALVVLMVVQVVVAVQEIQDHRFTQAAQVIRQIHPRHKVITAELVVGQPEQVAVAVEQGQLAEQQLAVLQEMVVMALHHQLQVHQ